MFQPSMKRGFTGPQRPMTAGKLSDIAATKYSDSIFKVYIPEATCVMKKKRVIPITDIKPMTPPRSSRLTAIRAHQVPCPDSMPKNARPKITHPESRTAEVFSGMQTCSPPGSPNVPKRITLIADISLTKEQEAKRLRDRSAKKKRTMNSVKKVFPPKILDECNQKSENENDMVVSETLMCVDENSSLYQRKPNFKNRSSLKTYSGTSRQNAVWAKKSVTWKEDVITDSSSIGMVSCKTLVDSNLKKKRSSFDSIKSLESRSGKSADSSCNSSETAEYPNENSKFTSRLRTTRKNYCSREIVAKRRQLREQRINRNKHCSCCNVRGGRNSETLNRVIKNDFQETSNSRFTAVEYNRNSKNIKEILCKDDENIHQKRNAIYHTSDATDGDESDSCQRYIIKRTSNSEDTDSLRRVVSTPSMSTYEGYSFGSSDSEHSSQSDNFKKTVPRTDYDDKPLKKIFETATNLKESKSMESDEMILKDRIEQEKIVELNVISEQVDLKNDQILHTVDDTFSDHQPLSVTNSKEFCSPHDSKKKIIVKNSKSLNSLDCYPLEMAGKGANQIVKRKSSICDLTKIQLDKSCLLAETYNELHDVGRRVVNQSESLLIESSNSLHVARESPLLDIPYEEGTARSDEQVQSTIKLNTYLSALADKVSKCSLNNASQCLKSTQKSIPDNALIENQTEYTSCSRATSKNLYFSTRSSPEKKYLGVIVPKDNRSFERNSRSPTFKPNVSSNT